MKQKFLFWVALATMLVTGALSTDVSASLKVLGNTIPIKDGTSTVGNITIEQSVEDRTLIIQFGERSVKTLDVVSSESLIYYFGDDFDIVLVAFDEDLEINHSMETEKVLFNFWNSNSDLLDVYLMNNNDEDVTLKINMTYEKTGVPVFNLYNTTLHLNPLGTGLVDDDKIRKLNIDIETASNMIFNDNQETRSYVDLDYGDFHFAFTNAARQGDVFHNNIVVSGLGRLDTYDERNYVTQPQGLGFYFDGNLAGLYKCETTLSYTNRYQGEVTLTYAPSSWQYFGPGDYSSWRLQEGCDGSVVLKVICAGDLSALDSEDLPWYPFKDIITRVELQEDALYPCDKLPKGAFKGFTALTSASLSGLYGLKEISDELFMNCSKLADLTFPAISEGIETIGNHAFWMCQKLTKMEIPETVEEIGDNAFYFCRNLEVTLPKSLKKVGYRAFDQCNTVTMPKEIGENVGTVLENEEEQWASVFRIVRLVFPGTLQEWLARDNKWIMNAWTNYTSDGGHLNIGGEDVVDLVIPNGITELKPYAFANATHIKTVTFPSTLTKIGDRAFYENKLLEAADLPDNITGLGEECFAYSGIESLKLPKDLTVIPEGAFGGCENLASLTLPEGLLGISVGAFEGCEALQTLVLPNSVTAIAPAAFAGSGLKEVTLPKSLNYIDISAFGSCLFLTTINIPAGMGDVEFDMSGLKELTGLTIDELSDEQKMILGFALVNEIRFSGDLNEWLTKSRPWLMKYLSPLTYDWENVDIVPHEVSLYLADSDEPVNELVIPEGVTAIPEEAFRLINMASLTLPAGVTEIGARAFDGCTALLTAESKAAVPPTLGADAFKGIDEKATLYVTTSAVAAYKASDWSKYFTIEGAGAEYNISVTVKGIDPELVEITGAGTYTEGDDATLSFKLKDETHYTFSMWLFDENNFRTTQTLTFENMDADHEVEIVFNVNKYSVTATVKPAEGGVVKGQGEYDYGTNYTLTLEPAEGYELKEWRDGVALDEKTNTLSGIVYGNINIECVLQLKHYTITAAVNDEKMGTVTGAGSYEHGSEVTLTAKPNDGYQFVNWSNGSTDNPLKFTAKEEVSLTANFELIPVKEFTLTVVASPAEGGQVIGSGTYKEGEEAQLVASANTGYNFVEWKEDGDKNAIRKVKVTADATYTALFEKQQAPKPEYTITVAASPAEGGTVEGGGKYEEGKTATLTANAAEGYEFVQWSDGVKDNPRVVTVTANATYTAEFKKKEVLPTEYTVTVYVSPEESGKVEGAGTYKEGETATLVALPAFGYLFDKWSDGNTENPRDIVVDKKWTLICYFTLISDGIEDINGSKSEEQGQKVLRNGKLYIILPDGREFDTTGKKIK